MSIMFVFCNLIVSDVYVCKCVCVRVFGDRVTLKVCDWFLWTRQVNGRVMNVDTAVLVHHISIRRYVLWREVWPSIEVSQPLFVCVISFEVKVK